MSTYLEIKSHDTPADMFASLSRAFGEQENGGVRWVEFEHDGVRLTFYAPRGAAKPTEEAIADAFTPPNPFSVKA